ncbi:MULTISPECIES: sigma-70 family RNA polymerase sigma factor [Paenibacillus]|uniref:sigma-70 family RNA polymerase sigma factor n=1 Tax=Paenibacillus TaxID=44249 RepID=UPI003009547F
MRNNNHFIEAVEKGFSSYIKSCLQHASRDYFKKLNRESYRVAPLDESAHEIDVVVGSFTTSAIVDDYASLSQALDNLTTLEKKVIYLKFYQDKTDKEIAQILGVSRQAISKFKTTILVKLKVDMEL